MERGVAMGMGKRRLGFKLGWIGFEDITPGLINLTKCRVWGIAATTGRFDTAFHVEWIVSYGPYNLQALRSFDAWESKSRFMTRQTYFSFYHQTAHWVPFENRFSDFLQLPLTRESGYDPQRTGGAGPGPESAATSGLARKKYMYIPVKAGRSHPSRPRHSHSATRRTGNI